MASDNAREALAALTHRLAERPMVRITAATPSLRERATELWQARELLYFLVLRDIKLRYKQTLLGGLWAVLQPAAMLAVFFVVFRKIETLSPAGVPYPLFLSASLVLWVYLANALSSASMSMIQASNSNLISKIYFPRLVIPLASVLSPLVDMAISFVLLAAVMVYYKYPLHWQCVFVIPALLFTVMLVAGAGAWICALNVKYRDVRHALPFAIQLWLFASPVLFSYTVLPNWQALLAMNPSTGLLEAYRSALFATPFDLRLCAISAGLILFVFVGGLVTFYRMEREFADIL